jgi:glycosyltransferase involved in cell wall biosynthesis
MVIKYDTDEMTKAIITLLSNKPLLEEYRNNAFEYSKQFDWNYIFDGAINEVIASNSECSS